MASWTAVENNRLAVVPQDTTITRGDALKGETSSYILKTTQPPPPATMIALRIGDAEPARSRPSRPASPSTPGSGRCSSSSCLLTVVITNVPLRGLWSFLVIILLVVIALFITRVPRVGLTCSARSANLHIYINMAGYLFIATVVFILWAVAVFIFDRRTYMRITPGQIKVCEHIGDVDPELRHDGDDVREAARRPVPALACWGSAPAT